MRRPLRFGHAQAAALTLVLSVPSTAVTVRGQAPSTETSGEGPSTANGAWTLASFPPVAFPKGKVPEAQALADQGQQLMNQLRTAEARALFERAIEIDPAQPYANWRLGQIQGGPGGSRELGLSTFRRLLDLAPSAQAYLHAAMALSLQNYLDESIQVWREGTKRYPADRNMASLFGETLMRAGQVDEAVKVFEVEVAARPGSSRLQLNLGRALARLGKGSEAAPYLRRAAELEPTADMRLTAAATMASSGVELDLALSLAEGASGLVAESLTLENVAQGRGVALTPMARLFMTWDTLSAVHGARGNVEGAHAYGLAAWKLSPNAPTAIRLGRMFQDRSDFAAAARAYALGAVVGGAAATEATDRLSAMVTSQREATDLMNEVRAGRRAATMFNVPRAPGPAWSGSVVVLVDKTGIASRALIVPGPASAPDGIAEAVGNLKFESLAPPESQIARLVHQVLVSCTAESTTCAVRVQPSGRSLSQIAGF